MPPGADAVLVIAFGGPNAMEDVRPFLATVLRGRPVPPERVEEVVQHYAAIGGRSPLTEITLRQADALRARLAGEGTPLPVYVGMRNWHPYLRDTLAAMQRDRVQRAVGVILAAQQSEASWGRYQGNVADARAALAGQAPQIEFAPNWHAHPLFIEAVAARVAAARVTIPAARREAARVVFTAHSIPVAMAADAPYEAQVRAGAILVARRLDIADFVLSYQSRSGSPREPWLGPDIAETVRAEAARGTRDLLVVPIGFVCDHVEVLYDLDVEARQVADSVGITLTRAAAVNDHPAFIQMLAAVVRAQLSG
jgi:protoporphyrin/coproporphyrin ferrochelatase